MTIVDPSTRVPAEGDAGRHNDGLRRFGRPKQKRNDGLLVTLAPMLDSAGFPRCCEILPGNLFEPETLETALSRLEAEYCRDGLQPTVVTDSSITSKDNFA